MSSIWVTRAYIGWANSIHHSLIKFDECRLGQVVVKATALSTDLPLHHWHGLRCNHEEHPRREKLNSSDLSRYPEEMMQSLAAATVCRAVQGASLRFPVTCGVPHAKYGHGGTASRGSWDSTTPKNSAQRPGEATLEDNTRQSARWKAGKQALAGLTLGTLPGSALGHQEDDKVMLGGDTFEVTPGQALPHASMDTAMQGDRGQTHDIADHT